MSNIRNTTSELTEQHLLEDLEDNEVEVFIEPLANSRRVLEETPNRVLTFLRGVGTQERIMIALASRGYTRADHVEGWRRLEAAGGFDPSAIDEPFSTGVAEAIAKLDEWATDNYPVIQASLRVRFPEQHFFLTTNLELERGAAAVLMVKQLCDRMDALVDAPEREDTRPEDASALQLLAQRGIGDDARRRLRVLIAAAQAAPAVDPDELQEEAAQEEAQLRALQELRVWFEEWSAIARVAVSRRADLIRLGLARRRPRSEMAEPGPVPAPAPASNLAPPVA